MNKPITVSAPGKLMLLGEYAVVVGYPCLVTAVDKRIFVTVAKHDPKKDEERKIFVDSLNTKIGSYEKSIDELGEGEIPKGVRFVEMAVRNFCDKYPFDESITISTKADFSSQFGFGSSSAVTVAVIKALAELFGVSLSEKELFDLSYKTVLDIQKKGSGFDVAAAVYGGTLYFVKGGEKLEKLSVGELPIIVGYSRVKADTVSLMDSVAEKWRDNAQGLEHLYKKIGELVEKAKESLIKKDMELFGQLMSQNQKLLQQLGASTKKLDIMIDAAKKAGAYGAKLSGAGGGDCIITVSEKRKTKSVKLAIEKAGGEVIDVRTNAKGARKEI